MKKYISIFIILVLQLSMFTNFNFTANATEAVEQSYVAGDYTYTVDNNEATIVDYTGDETGIIEIPSIRGGYNVTKIGDNAFDYSNFATVVIPSTVKNIGNEAFFIVRIFHL